MDLQKLKAAALAAGMAELETFARKLRGAWTTTERAVCASVHGITDFDTWADRVRCSPKYGRELRAGAAQHLGLRTPENGGPAFGEG